MYNTIRGSTNFWINNYPACVGVLPPGDIDPNDVDCTIAYCPKSADVQNTYSVTDGDFDLIRNRCDTNGEGAGGGYQNERYSLQVYKNLNYRPPVAKRNETRAHPRDVGARQADGVSPSCILICPIKISSADPPPGQRLHPLLPIAKRRALRHRSHRPPPLREHPHHHPSRRQDRRHLRHWQPLRHALGHLHGFGQPPAPEQPHRYEHGRRHHPSRLPGGVERSAVLVPAL